MTNKSIATVQLVMLIHTVNGNSNDFVQLEALWTNKGWDLLQWEGLLVSSVIGANNFDIQVEVLDKSLWWDSTDLLIAE